MTPRISISVQPTPNMACSSLKAAFEVNCQPAHCGFALRSLLALLALRALGALRLRAFVFDPLHALLELGNALSERPGNAGNALTAEKQQREGKKYEKFCLTDSEHGSSPFVK